MKLSIKTSVLHHLTNAFIQSASVIQNAMENHVDLQKIYENKAVEKAKLVGQSLTDFKKRDKERQEENKKAFLSEAQFVQNIKDKVTKVYTVTKTEEEVSVEINPEFLTDCIDWSFNIFNRFLPLVVEFIFIIEEEEGSEKALKEKWELNTEPEIHTESKTLNVVYSYNGWDFVYDDYNTQSPLLLKDGETCVMVDDFKILNTSSHAVYNFNGFRFKYVLNNNKFSLSKYPESLQEALKAILSDHYKIEL